MSLRGSGSLAYIDRSGKIYELSQREIEELQIDVKRIAAACADRSRATTITGQRLNNVSGYESLSKHMGEEHDGTWTGERLRQFANGRGGNAIYQRIGSLIEGIKSISDQSIVRDIERVAPSLSASDRASITNSNRRIAIEFDDGLEKQNSFTGEYAGTYIIFRKHGDSEYSTAIFEIGGQYYDDIPTFCTTRNLRNPRIGKKRVEGIVFRSEGMIYAIGFLENSGHARLSILHRYEKRNLYGLRLGLMPSERQPFCTSIFCLHISNEKLSKRDKVHYVSQYTGVFEKSDFIRRFENIVHTESRDINVSLEAIIKLVEPPDNASMVLSLGAEST